MKHKVIFQEFNGKVVTKYFFTKLGALRYAYYLKRNQECKKILVI